MIFFTFVDHLFIRDLAYVLLIKKKKYRKFYVVFSNGLDLIEKIIKNHIYVFRVLRRILFFSACFYEGATVLV